jgi:hypothetical protein
MLLFLDFIIGCIVKKSSRQGEFHPKPLTEPYVIVSHHTALVVLKVMLHENHAANVQKDMDNVWQYALSNRLLCACFL